MSTVIYNLRSGYAKLNDYCHKLNVTSQKVQTVNVEKGKIKINKIITVENNK
jgi:hypothetical protein